MFDMQECMLVRPIDIEMKRLAGHLHGESNEANASMFIPFILFNREETIEHLRKSKEILDQMVI